MKTNEPWSDVPDFELYDEGGYWQEEIEENDNIMFW